MINMYRYAEIVPIYKKILSEYLNWISEYSFLEYEINENELVYLIEDSFIIYIGLKLDENMHKWIERSHGTRIEEPEIYQLYHIVFEELSYNELFNFPSAKFTKKNNHFYDFCIYKKFNGEIDFIDPYGKNYRDSNFNYIDNELPELNLRNRFQSWNGFLVNYIIYELKENKKNGYGICYTTDFKTTQYAFKKVKDLEMCGLEENYQYVKYGNRSNEMRSHNGVHANKEMISLLFDIIRNNMDEKWENVKQNINGSSYLAEKLHFFVVPTFVKEKRNIWKTANEILKRAELDEFHDFERIQYDISEYKWKSEQQCLECVKKIYKNKKIIHQHRPYFLRTESGQLSYDIYISGLKIALEYQGKQHFEPVDFFGGEENYKLQKKRDEIKKELSEQNGIKLVYINYWENITVELLKNKIKEAI